MARVPDNVIEEMRGSHMLAIFLHIATTPPTRVWLGVNDIPAGIDSVDPTTKETYIGGGWLREIPNLEIVVNGRAERADFILSGIKPGDTAQVDFDELTAEIRGKAFRIGITTLDEYYQPMSSIIPLIYGKVSHPTESSPTVTGDESPSVTLGLSVGFGATTRDRASQVLWSTPHHKSKFPTDRFCDQTARLERGSNPTWPRGG
jgi:hypothetical protein